MILKTLNRILLVSSLLALSPVSAVADDITVGYCDGAAVQSSLSGTGSVAISLPKETFGMYRGTSVIGMRVGLGADAAKGITVFLKESPESQDILTFHSGTLYKGWNEIYFDSPITYPDGDLWAGYEFGVTDRPGLSGFDGLTSTGSCWVMESTGWRDRSPQGVQPLCIQLIMDGASYGVNDVAMLKADNITATAGDPFNVTGYVRNNTSSILSKARMSLECGSEHIEADAEVQDILPGEIGRFSLPIERLNITGQYEATVSVLSADGKEDEIQDNNCAAFHLGLVRDYVTRKVLIEEFTGMRCINCPTGQQIVVEALKGFDDYVMIAHHIGFGRDALTAPGSEDLLWFYNDNGHTFAPGLMIDRANTGDTPGPVTKIGEAKWVRDLIDGRAAVPAEETVDILRNYDPATRVLSLQVTAARIEGAVIGSAPVITVCLVENGIIGPQEPAYDDYEHNEANRMFVTAPLGDPIDLAGGDPVAFTYTVHVDENWNSGNMEVVAFVSNYDSEDCNRCTVYNAGKCTLEGSDPISGVDPVIPDSLDVEGIYSLTGTRQDSLRPGLNIIRYGDGSARKIIMK